jgi:2-amino-4-hydroxy-6-hydroxymethyldihydropteridine diphosphokinase
MRYFLSLGSNVGQKIDNLAKAVHFMEQEGVKILAASALYETQPVDISSQPWFLNQVLEIESEKDPESLLNVVKAIEQRMGRTPSRSKEPRIIDIDILLAEEMIFKTKTLEIPHPRLAERNFVLIPLKEIAPDAVHPVLNLTVEDLWRKSSDRSIVRKWEDEK